MPVKIFRHNNKKEGKRIVTASEVQGFPNQPASFPNLLNAKNEIGLDSTQKLVQSFYFGLKIELHCL